MIRDISDDDVADVIALWHAAGVARPWNDPAKDIAFARLGSHATVLVADIAGRIVASAMVGEDGHRGWVHYLAAHPDHQGRGLGRTMMDAAENWLSGKGVWKVQLLVRDDNLAVKQFYQHLGYHDTRSTCLQKIIG